MRKIQPVASSARAAMWLLAAACGFAQAASADDVLRGHELYVQKGCFECHGYVGQGSIMTAPALAPSPIPVDAMIAYVHAPKGQMPPYSKKILSDYEIRNIHAYLSALPPPPEVARIALLADASTGRPENSASHPEAESVATAGATRGERGQSVFAAHCAACHGALGQGGVGPTLRGIGERQGEPSIEAFVRHPSGGMPSLYPPVLSAEDVSNVARYVAALK